MTSLTNSQTKIDIWREAALFKGATGVAPGRPSRTIEHIRARSLRASTPVITGVAASRELDLEARHRIAYELGHNRIDVVGSYCGGSRKR